MYQEDNHFEESTSKTLLSPEQIRNLIIEKEKLNDNLLCGICNQFPILAKECSVCQQLYCTECIELLIQNIKQCPNNCSEKEIILNEPHRILKNSLNQVLMRCINEDCHKIINFESFYFHLGHCEEQTYQCINPGCNEKIKIKDKDEHKKYCRAQNFKCDKCLERYDKNIKHDCIRTLKKHIINLEQIVQELNQNLQVTNKKFTDLQEFIYKQQQIIIENKQSQNNQCKKHLMEWIIPQDNKICNYCDESDKSIRFHCKECNFYGCEKCFKPKLNDSKCPLNHPLNLKINNFNNPIQKCDLCNTNSCFEQIFYNDRSCDFKICQHCFKKYNS